jgi:hypothetical protein
MVYSVMILSLANNYAMERTGYTLPFCLAATYPCKDEQFRYFDRLKSVNVMISLINTINCVILCREKFAKW